MSRIIVKNIGQNTSEKQLKDLFSSKGEVTDVRIIKTASGKSRQFAFIGFRNEQQAKEAQCFFNNSFLHTSKLSVDIAKAVGDKSLEHETKSRYTKNKLDKAKKAAEKLARKEYEEKKKQELEQRKAERNKRAKLDEKGNKNKGEFMEVMKSRQQAHIWGNDTKDFSQVPSSRRGDSSELDDNSDAHESDSDEDITKGRRRNNQRLHRSFQPSDSDCESLSESESFSTDSEDEEANNEEDFNPPANSSAMSDMDYLRSKIVKKKEITVSDSNDSGSGSDSESDSSDDGGVDSDGINDDGGNDEQEVDSSMKADGDEKEGREDDTPDEDGRLFIRNIPFSCVETEILEVFSPFGTVSQVHLPLDADKKCKGFGFVQFLLPEDASRALAALDGSSFQGRLLHVMLAKQQAAKEEPAEGIKSKNSHLSSFQQKREAERKKMAHKRDGWNASFVRSDAVVDALSDKYGVARGDILDTDGVGGGEMAVRLAIGETHVIQENQEFFSSHGVDIHVLESALRRGEGNKDKAESSKSESAKRSATTLLIKNLPHDLIEAELEDMFTKYGAISSFLVPKSKTVAVVDFVEPSEARKAFSGLAYRKYHHTPLYLEWAPVNTIDRSKAPVKKKDATASESVSDGATDASSKRKHEQIDNTEMDSASDFSTLFVKNLNFLTDEMVLRDHLIKSLGMSTSDIRAVSLPRKKKGDQLLSMGFGFIEFTTSTGASKMLGRINGSVLDGHQLEAKPSDKRLSSTPNLASMKEAELEVEKDKSASSKLLVRNIAFQATQDELRGLFATFGAVKRIRIPRKMGGVHRGFAFVDFSSKKEAALAKKALSNSHLYGRHLVIEYAKEDDDNDLSKLREKASNDKQAIRLSASGGKKRKATDALQSQEESEISDILA